MHVHNHVFKIYHNCYFQRPGSASCGLLFLLPVLPILFPSRLLLAIRAVLHLIQAHAGHTHAQEGAAIIEDSVYLYSNQFIHRLIKQAADILRGMP